MKYPGLADKCYRTESVTSALIKVERFSSASAFMHAVISISDVAAYRRVIHVCVRQVERIGSTRRESGNRSSSISTGSFRNRGTKFVYHLAQCTHCYVDPDN